MEISESVRRLIPQNKPARSVYLVSHGLASMYAADECLDGRRPVCQGHPEVVPRGPSYVGGFSMVGPYWGPSGSVEVDDVRINGLSEVIQQLWRYRDGVYINFISGNQPWILQVHLNVHDVWKQTKNKNKRIVYDVMVVSWLHVLSGEYIFRDVSHTDNLCHDLYRPHLSPSAQCWYVSKFAGQRKINDTMQYNEILSRHCSC